MIVIPAENFLLHLKTQVIKGEFEFDNCILSLLIRTEGNVGKNQKAFSNLGNLFFEIDL